jgi:hypothetical protein
MRPIGGRHDKPIDVWILAATDQELREVQLGKLQVLIPPLRQRPDDIILLAEHFLARVSAQHSLPPKSFALDAKCAACLWLAGQRPRSQAGDRACRVPLRRERGHLRHYARVTELE